MLLKFKRINVGHPKPIEEDHDEDTDWTASTQIKGKGCMLSCLLSHF